MTKNLSFTSQMAVIPKNGHHFEMSSSLDIFLLKLPKKTVCCKFHALYRHLDDYMSYLLHHSNKISAFSTIKLLTLQIWAIYVPNCNSFNFIALYRHKVQLQSVNTWTKRSTAETKATAVAAMKILSSDTPQIDWSPAPPHGLFSRNCPI